LAEGYFCFRFLLPRALRGPPGVRWPRERLQTTPPDDARSRSNRGEITTRVRPLTSSVAADQEERHWQVNGGHHFENVAVVACYRRKQNPPVGSGAEDFRLVQKSAAAQGPTEIDTILAKTATSKF
jgi:hypothetical protein